MSFSMNLEYFTAISAQINRSKAMRKKMSDEKSIPVEYDYSFWKWHLKPWNLPIYAYWELTVSGKRFANFSMLGMFYCGLVGTPLSYFFLISVFHITDWPKAYHGIGGGIVVLVCALVTFGLYYLIFPTIGKICYSHGGINEEQLQIIQKRRVPGSFILHGVVVSKPDSDENPETEHIDTTQSVDEPIEK